MRIGVPHHPPLSSPPSAAAPNTLSCAAAITVILMLAMPYSHAINTPPTLNSLELIDDNHLDQWGEHLYPPSTSYYHQYHYASAEEETAGMEKTSQHHRRRNKKMRHQHTIRKSKARSRHLEHAVVDSGCTLLNAGRVKVSASINLKK